MSVTVAHKSTEAESERYQLVGSLREIVDLLKVELKGKQATINNLLDIIKNFTVNENKKDGNREQQAIKVRCKGNDDDDIVRELLQIDQLQHQFQKLKDQLPSNSFGVSQDCH